MLLILPGEEYGTSGEKEVVPIALGFGYTAVTVDLTRFNPAPEIRTMSRPAPSRPRVLTFGIAFCLATIATAAGPEDSRSALDRDPQGWTDLLADAGADLKGWSRGPIPPGGKLGEPSQWSLDTRAGTLVCQGNGGHEWVRWDKELGDFVYHVEWRFTPDPDKKKYNSGIYVRNSADAKIWHQAQTGDASGGFIFGDTLVGGELKRINLSKQLLDKRVRPAGEWNTYEITCKGKDVTLWTNGAVTCEWKECDVPRGYVGLEAEGYRIEFRNVKVKPL